MLCAKNALRSIVKAIGAQNATRRTMATLILESRGRLMRRILKLRPKFISLDFNEIESTNKITDKRQNLIVY